MKKLIVFFTILFSTSVCLAAKVPVNGPIAVLDAPDTAALGETIWLDADGSKGKSFQWMVLPEAGLEYFKAFPIYDGLDAEGKPTIKHLAYFESPNKQIYYFLFVVTEGDVSIVAKHVLNNGGAPQPDPDIDPDVDPDIDPDVDPDITIDLPDIKKPPLYLQALVEPINKIDIEKKDAIELLQFYWDFADTIERDTATKTINTTGAIRQLNQRAGGLMFQQSGIKGKYDGLPEIIDNVFVEVLSLENIELTSTKRSDIVNACRAISWMFLQIIEE